LLSFLKNKPVLSDLIPNNYIDIHSHLLPGIDDGAKSIEDTQSLLIALKKIGFSQFITTPHVMKHVWDNTSESIQEKLGATTAELKTKNTNIQLKVAAEYLMDGEFMKLFQSEPLLTLKENHVLVEMSYINPPIQLYDILFELQVSGYKPVLAHPERYSFYHNNFSEYLKLKNVGCLFQLNLLSTVGYYGEGVTKTASKLLEKGLIDFVGSDVHHQNHVTNFDKKIKIKDILSLKEAIDNNHFFKF
jgi:tyrosine-protein phosphatase YwqE